METTQTLILAVAFMSLTFVAGAAVYWALTTVRRPPPEE